MQASLHTPLQALTRNRPEAEAGLQNSGSSNIQVGQPHLDEQFGGQTKVI